MFLNTLEISAQASIIGYLAYYFLLFIIYSFIGWVFECFWVSLQKKKLENRGFLFGPICPIYGVGSLLAIFTTSFIKLPWYLEFLLIAIVCDLIEYSTSVILEKIYHVRWWDYTNEWKYHLNGRISIETSIGFGLGGLLVVHSLQPFFSRSLINIPKEALLIVATAFGIILIIDVVLSTIAISSVKNILQGGHVDLTNEIKKISRNYYRKASRLSRKVTRTAVKRMKTAKNTAKKNLKKKFSR